MMATKELFVDQLGFGVSQRQRVDADLEKALLFWSTANCALGAISPEPSRVGIRIPTKKSLAHDISQKPLSRYCQNSQRGRLGRVSRRWAAGAAAPALNHRSDLHFVIDSYLGHFQSNSDFG